jgi:hypothetical protein
MIKGVRKGKPLNKEEILKKISTYDIYRQYQGPFALNEITVNKHRGETNPSLIISSKLHFDLRHKDFGDSNWRGDCFNFVQQIYKCDYNQALIKINTDFDLGLGEPDRTFTGNRIVTWEQPVIERKPPPLIQVVYYANMTKSYMDYWARLEQGESDLRRERIFQPKEIWRNKRKVPLGELITFCYQYEDKWKIYRPFAPKKALFTPMNQWKWDSNVPFDYLDNIQAIKPNCSKAFLAKSKKDRMVLQKALQTDCMSDAQAEDPACLTIQALNSYKAIDWRYVIADNDKKGKEFSWWLTGNHGFKHVNVPDLYLGQTPKCTDFADLCYHYGIQKVIDHFKNKQII